MEIGYKRRNDISLLKSIYDVKPINDVLLTSNRPFSWSTLHASMLRKNYRLNSVICEKLIRISIPMQELEFEKLLRIGQHIHMCIVYTIAQRKFYLVQIKRVFSEC